MNYPLQEVLKIMKPCKLDLRKKKSHVEKLESIMKPAGKLHNKYVLEMKLDGISGLSIGGRLFSNVTSKVTGFPAEKTAHLPQISDVLMELPRLVLDGEIWKFGLKSNNVTSITNVKDPREAIAKQEQRGPLQYWIYDILFDVDGTDLRNQPFAIRRARLEEVYHTYFSKFESIVLNEIHYGQFEERLDDWLAAGLEGGVLKSVDGQYKDGKRPMWNQIKLKQEMEDDVVICGYNQANRKYEGKNLDTWPYWDNGQPVTEHWAKDLIGSLVIGKYNDEDQLVEVGNVTGISDTLRAEFTAHQADYLGTVIKIKAMEKTADGKYRHANMLDFHNDKRAEECKLNEND